MSDLALSRRLLKQTRPAWGKIMALFVVGLLGSPLALLVPIPLKIAVDSVLGNLPLPGFLDAVVPDAVASSPGALLALVGLLAVLIALLALGQGLAQKYLNVATGERLVLDFRARLFRHLQRLSLSYHDSAAPADSAYRIQADAPAIRSIIIDNLLPTVSSAATVAAMLYVTIRLDWQLALVALAVTPPLVFASRTYRPRLRAQARKARKLESAAMGVVHEVLGALRVVKAFGGETREADRFVRRGEEGVRQRISVALAEGRLSIAVGVMIAAGTAAVLFIGVGHVRAGVLSLGDLLLIMTYLGKLYDPLKTISSKMATLQGYLASAERAFALMDEVPDVVDRPDARPLARAEGTITVQHVSFAYPGNRPALHDVSFSIRAGTRLGIVGATGAGKTTLISLLTRFYDPSDGAILLDGIDLRAYRLDDLRRQFAVVLQDPVLFSMSIADNIAYAAPDATRDEIVAAAQAANVHEVIERLPQGYDTEVGERGVKLSGGQRQRIALARAFLKDSPILILDEPTSAVDTETEATIVEALERLQRGRTVIIISHRPTALERCSAVLVLENGRVTEVAESLPGPATPTWSLPPAAAGGKPRSPSGRLLAHPAVQAWRQLMPNGRIPDRITPAKLKEKPTSVYRLEGAGPGGVAVIAKRCPRATAKVERAVYEEILSRLQLPTAGYYGCVEDPEGERPWLFMDELRGEEYFHMLAQHRVYAGRWLGALHAKASALAPTAVVAQLPDAGPACYLEHLHSAQGFIRTHLDNPVLSGDDVAFLEHLLTRCDELEERWDRVEQLCARMPRTLVHGDFNGKNMRVQATGAEPGIVVFDWEDAGWGVPAADLAQLALPSSRMSANPDLDTYWSTARDYWPHLDRTDLDQAASCGTVFRTLAAIDWDSRHLTHEWAQRFVGSLRLYDAELEHALRRLDNGRRVPTRHEVAQT